MFDHIDSVILNVVKACHNMPVNAVLNMKFEWLPTYALSLLLENLAPLRVPRCMKFQTETCEEPLVEQGLTQHDFHTYVFVCGLDT